MCERGHRDSRKMKINERICPNYCALLCGHKSQPGGPSRERSELEKEENSYLFRPHLHDSKYAACQNLSR